MQESGSDSLMLFQKKGFTAKDVQTLFAQPQREEGQREQEGQQEQKLVRFLS